MPLECGIIFDGIPEGAISRKVGLIWAIPVEILGRIYEFGFTTKGHRGSGLGLSVSQGIAARHGGRIEVESEEGVGSVFSPVLPLAGDDNPGDMPGAQAH